LDELFEFRVVAVLVKQDLRSTKVMHSIKKRGKFFNVLRDK
jgi:hypothetical protein